MSEYDMKQTFAPRTAEQERQTAAQAQKTTNGIPNSVMADVFAGKRAATSEMMGRRSNLAPSIAAKMSQAFGMDVSGVQVYRSDAMSGSSMHGMASGNKVVLSSDVDLNTMEGQAILGHELSHIRAQSQGIGTGSGLLQNASLEHQADAEGMMAARGMSISGESMGMAMGLGMAGVENLTPVGPGMGASAGAPMQANKDDPQIVGSVSDETKKKFENRQHIQGAKRGDTFHRGEFLSHADKNEAMNDKILDLNKADIIKIGSDETISEKDQWRQAGMIKKTQEKSVSDLATTLNVNYANRKSEQDKNKSAVKDKANERAGEYMRGWLDPETAKKRENIASPFKNEGMATEIFHNAKNKNQFEYHSGSMQEKQFNAMYGGGNPVQNPEYAPKSALDPKNIKKDPQPTRLQEIRSEAKKAVENPGEKIKAKMKKDEDFAKRWREIQKYKLGMGITPILEVSEQDEKENK